MYRYHIKNVAFYCMLWFDERMEEQIILMEMKLAYLEDTVKTLNELIIQMGHKIDSLESKKDMLQEQVSSLMESRQEMPHIRPPHY